MNHLEIPTGVVSTLKRMLNRLQMSHQDQCRLGVIISDEKSPILRLIQIRAPADGVLL